MCWLVRPVALVIVSMAHINEMIIDWGKVQYSEEDLP
jgi:hypothetical protein